MILRFYYVVNLKLGSGKGIQKIPSPVTVNGKNLAKKLGMSGFPDATATPLFSSGYHISRDGFT